MKTDLSKELKTWLREQHITMDSKIRNDMSFERDTKYDEGYVAAISDMIFKLEDLASGGEKAVVWAENINKKIDRRLSSMTLPLVHEQEEEDWHKQYRLVLRGCKERIKESLKLNLPDDQMQDVMLYLDDRRYEAEHNPFFHEGIVDACNLCLEYITDETNKYYDEMGNNGLTEQQLENVKKEISGYKDLANARWWMVKSPERCKYYSGFYDGIVQALKIIGIEESNG